MSARFRIRTKEGQEISFASHEIFAEFVRSGDLAPDDVVYDAETKEWSPARTHPVVLQIELEAEDAAAEGGTRASEGPGESAPGRASAGGPYASEFDFDLAPAPAGLTPEEEAAAFVAKMEAERASERNFDEASIQGFKMEKGASSVVENLTPAPPPRRTWWSREREEPREQEPSPRRDRAPAARREAPTAVPARPKRKGARGPARRYAPFVVLGLVAVAGGVYFGPALMVPRDGGSVDAGSDVVEPPPPAVPATEEALRARARERFLTSTQAALRGLDQVPDVWLRGIYLAGPSDYPRVREVWEEYLAIIRDVRAGDSERYRQAYLRALDDARVDGATRTLRLARAMTDFQAAAAPRVAHYDRVERLATAALQGHDALAAAEGTIAYQPARGPTLSEDPVIEAVGRSPEAQALLNRVLDRILGELHGERGPGEARNVRAWVWDGLLDAVTS
jgi:hypothetical protein